MLQSMIPIVDSTVSILKLFPIIFWQCNVENYAFWTVCRELEYKLIFSNFATVALFKSDLEVCVCPRSSATADCLCGAYILVKILISASRRLRLIKMILVLKRHSFHCNCHLYIPVAVK